MTVGELKAALGGLPERAQAVVYADLSGPVVHPFADLEERVSLCGYYALAAVEPQAEEVVLTLGQPLDI